MWSPSGATMTTGIAHSLDLADGVTEIEYDWNWNPVYPAQRVYSASDACPWSEPAPAEIRRATTAVRCIGRIVPPYGRVMMMMMVPMSCVFCEPQVATAPQRVFGLVDGTIPPGPLPPVLPVPVGRSMAPLGTAPFIAPPRVTVMSELVWPPPPPPPVPPPRSDAMSLADAVDADWACWLDAAADPAALNPGSRCAAAWKACAAAPKFPWSCAASPRLYSRKASRSRVGRSLIAVCSDGVSVTPIFPSS